MADAQEVVLLNHSTRTVRLRAFKPVSLIEAYRRDAVRPKKETVLSLVMLRRLANDPLWF